MEAAKPKLVVIGNPERSPVLREVRSQVHSHGRSLKHPCEHCRCCACHKVCTKCGEICRPMEADLIPVIYCPDFADFRRLRPTRYLYRSDYDCEYRLHLPGTR